MTKTQNLKRLGRIYQMIRASVPKNDKEKAVRLYALEIVKRLRESISEDWADDAVFESPMIFHKSCLAGASDWFVSSFGGCFLCSNMELVKRLFSKKEYAEKLEKCSSNYLLELQAKYLGFAEINIWAANEKARSQEGIRK